jgi:site-specific DNA-adenine methylase
VGTKGEFRAPLSIRWDAQGGDSVRRFRNAAEGILAWRNVLDRCTFVLLDAFELIVKCKDEAKSGLYCDPPFPGPGAAYKIGFSDAEHARLAEVLAGFSAARVVVRLYETDLVRRLYPEGEWGYNRFTGRKASNRDSPEVLLVRNGG